MKLGIFDSGIGGEAVAASLRSSFPRAEILTANDQAHLPYGNRTQAEIIALTDTAIQPLLNAACDIIILACNTATAAAIETLRERYPDQRFIGLEPMIKPAIALTQSGTIAVCATPATLASARYRHLKDRYARDVTIIEPDCSSWARMIEDDEINERFITKTIQTSLDSGADVVVLACTHYHWIRELIEDTVAGRASVIDPSEAIARQVRSLLELR